MNKYDDYNLESLLAALETEYFKAKDHYQDYERTGHPKSLEYSEQAQRERLEIKQAIVNLFNRYDVRKNKGRE